MVAGASYEPYLDSSRKASSRNDCSRISGLSMGALGLRAKMESRARGANRYNGLHGPQAFEQQLGSSEHAKLSFEERLGLMVDREWSAREQHKLTRRLRAAKPRYRSASLEDVDFKHRPERPLEATNENRTRYNRDFMLHVAPLRRPEGHGS